MRNVNIIKNNSLIIKFYEEKKRKRKRAFMVEDLVASMLNKFHCLNNSGIYFAPENEPPFREAPARTCVAM